MLMQRWKKKTARQGSLIMRGEQRLLQAPLKRVVHTLYTLVDCGKADFRQYYLPVLQRFAQCCQAMPVHQGDEPYSLFLQGYERARHALAIQRGYCLSDESPSAMAVALLPYVIFTLALLKTLDQASLDRTICLLDARQHVWGQWSVLLGPMPDHCVTYQVQFQPTTPLLEKPLRLLRISDVLMPPLGLGWLAQERQLFVRWRQLYLYGEEDNDPIAVVIKAAEKNAGIHNKQPS